MKKITLRKRPQLARENKYTPIPAPVINHPSRKGWLNEAYEAYMEVFDRPLREASNDLAVPFPENSFGERFKFGLKTSMLKTMFSLLSFFKKERGTHQHGGVGAKGTIQFIQNEVTKQLPFCQNEKPISIKLRHSNASFEDDGCAQLRAMAFRIEHPDGEEEDFLLSTGAIIPFWSISSLINFAKYRGKVKDDNWEPQKEWVKNSPTAFVAGIESVRLAPSSYSKMSYYSAIPYGIEGTNNFVKFRVMPVGMDVESGLLTSEQQRKVWIQNRLDNNEKPQQYLADEYKSLLSSGILKYTLEAQIRTLDPAVDTDEFFNLARYWDDQKYPWVPIAEMSAATILGDDETKDLAFWLGNLPRGLDFMESHSGDDYNSIATGRIKIYPRPQRLRRR